MIKSSKINIKTRLVKPYIKVIVANTVGKFFDVFAASATWKFYSGAWVYIYVPEKINSRLMQMLWLMCDFFSLKHCGKNLIVVLS